MRRELPPHPHLDHLKKQAKDLLDAQRRREPAALERLRESLPSLAGQTPDEVARVRLALHDAQSAIAREYGCKSWHELRAAVAERNGESFPELVFSALLALGRPLPDVVARAMRDAWALRQAAARAATRELPESLPLLAARNVLLVPGAVVPINVGRAASLSAIEAALAASAPTLAFFAQRAAEAEEVTLEALHPIGCEAYLHTRVRDAESGVYIVVEGLRFISLRALSPAANAAAHALAHVAEVHTDRDDAADEVPRLTEQLRTRARRLASALPDAPNVLNMLEGVDDDDLPNLVIANLASPLADKVRYAAEPSLVGKLRVLLDLCDAQIAG
jgi:Lon protease-like protein